MRIPHYFKSVSLIGIIHFILLSPLLGQQGFQQISVVFSSINPASLNQYTREVMSFNTIWEKNTAIHYGSKLRYDYCHWSTKSTVQWGGSLEGSYYLKTTNFSPGQNYSNLSLDIVTLTIAPAVYYTLVRHPNFIFRMGLIPGLGLAHYTYQLAPTQDDAQTAPIIQLIIPAQLALASSEKFYLMLDTGLTLILSRGVRFKLTQSERKTNLNAMGFYIGLSATSRCVKDSGSCGKR